MGYLLEGDMMECYNDGTNPFVVDCTVDEVIERISRITESEEV